MVTAHTRTKGESWRILERDLAFPLGIEQIPIARQFFGSTNFWLHTSKCNGKAAWTDVLVVNIVIVMFAVEPFRNVFDFGEHQRRADWIESLCLVERRQP